MKKLISVFIILIMFSTCWTIYTGVGFAADKNTYWLKVNKKCNVVTVYKKSGSQYLPYRAMVCSTGKNNCTPNGTFSVKKKWNWQPLFGNVYGHYTTQFNGNYLFHSVPYKKKSNNYIEVAEYNKLGTQASKGCVRLSTIDAKWIYSNCCSGTKVTVYSSSNPGPLGKPTPMKMKGTYGYDPTNTDVESKCQLAGPVISISSSKEKKFEYGSRINIKSGVSAQSPYTFENLSSKIKVHKVYKYSEKRDRYEKYFTNRINTKDPGRYRVVYSCYDYYCGFDTVYKDFYCRVLPEPKPKTVPAENIVTEPTDENVENNSQGENPEDRSDMKEEETGETDE